jgi:hypothetical protein
MPYITSWSEVDGLVCVSVVIGPWGRECCAEDGPRRQAADDWSYRKAMMPSGLRRRRARNRTDRNCRAKREGGQGFFHHTISTSSHLKQSHVRYLTSFGRSAPQAHECKSPARSRHWRSSTIGSSLSNAAADKSHPGIDCYHGQPRLVLSGTGLDQPSIPISGDSTVTATLNRQAFEHAKQLINDGRIVLDDRDAWSEHRSIAEQEN